MDLNKVMLIGNITKDPQSRTTPSGQNVTTFSMATNSRWKDKNTGEMKEDSQFHNIVAWGRTGEVLTQYARKGSKIFVEGRLQTRSWDDQQTGQKRYTTEIVLDNVILLDRKNSTGGQGGYQAPAAPYNAANAKTTNQPMNQAQASPENISVPAPDQIPTINLDDSQDEIRVEDIPF
jgi:single-strand DNA-binding protein